MRGAVDAPRRMTTGGLGRGSVEDITLAHDLLDAARRLFDPDRRRGLNSFATPPRIYVDPRLARGSWHFGAPVEGPLLPGQCHPDGPVKPQTIFHEITIHHGPSSGALIFQEIAEAQAENIARLILGEEKPSETA